MVVVHYKDDKGTLCRRTSVKSTMNRNKVTCKMCLVKMKDIDFMF